MRPQFGNGLGLGSARGEVIRILGKPTREDANIMYYEEIHHFAVGTDLASRKVEWTVMLCGSNVCSIQLEVNESL